MKKKAQATSIISLVVAIVIGVAAALAIFIDLAVTQQTLVPVTDETVTMATGTSVVTLANLKVHPGTELITNSSGDLLTKDTDYVINNRLSTIRNVAAGNGGTGDWLVNYSYQPSAYATGGTTRTVLSIVPILFAIGLLVFIGRRAIVS